MTFSSHSSFHCLSTTSLSFTQLLPNSESSILLVRFLFLLFKKHAKSETQHPSMCSKTKTIILATAFLFGLTFAEPNTHNRVKRGYYSEGGDGPEYVEEMRTGEEVHFKSNAPPPRYYAPPDPGYIKFTWTFKAMDDCQLIVYFKEYGPGDRNCEYQTVLLSDEEVESNVCGYAKLDGDFKSTGKYLYIKHILRAGILPAYFSCHVKCLPRSADGQYEENPYERPVHRPNYYYYKNSTGNYTGHEYHSGNYTGYGYVNNTGNYTGGNGYANETSYYYGGQNYNGSDYPGGGYPDYAYYQAYYSSDGDYKYGYGGNDTYGNGTNYSGYGNGTGVYNGQYGNSSMNVTSRAALDGVEWIDLPDAGEANLDWIKKKEEAAAIDDQGVEVHVNYYEGVNIEPYEDS